MGVSHSHTHVDTVLDFIKWVHRSHCSDQELILYSKLMYAVVRQDNNYQTQPSLTSVSHHSLSSDHSKTQRAALSPMKAYLKSLRGISSAVSFLFVLVYAAVWLFLYSPLII